MTDKVQKIREFLVGIADADGVSTILARAIEKKILPYIDSLQEEPVSEDLDEAAKKYGTKKHPMTTIGAKESACDFKAGAQWKSEQMMAKSIDAHVNYAWSGLSFGGFNWSKTGLDLGDKCKLIIIKKD